MLAKEIKQESVHFIKCYLTWRPQVGKMPMELLEYIFQKLQAGTQIKDIQYFL